MAAGRKGLWSGVEFRCDGEKHILFSLKLEREGKPKKSGGWGCFSSTPFSKVSISLCWGAAGDEELRLHCVKAKAEDSQEERENFYSLLSLELSFN